MSISSATQSGISRGEALAADVALERRAHLDDVEVDGAGGDRLLQAGVVVGLGEVDPVDLGAGVGLPRLQEAAEQEVVQVLVVEPHEGQLDAGELALLRRSPWCRRGTSRRPSASRRRWASPCRRRGSSGSRRAGCPGRAPARVSAPSAPPEASASAAGAGGALQERAAAGLRGHQPLVVLALSCDHPPWMQRCRARCAGAVRLRRGAAPAQNPAVFLSACHYGRSGLRVNRMRRACSRSTAWTGRGRLG